MRILCLLLLVGMFFNSCTENIAQSKTTFENVSTIEFSDLLKEKKDIQLIDVRTEAEFLEEHLPNAVNIDIDHPTFEKKIKELQKDKPTFIYCLSGGRSQSALSILEKNGFTEVYNMQGGIIQWKGDQLDLTGAEANPNWKGMTKDQYNILINNEIPVLIDFSATWCGPCKQLKPVLAEIEKEYSGKIKIVTIDIDENKSLAESMQIRNIPFMIFYKKGNIEMNIEGFADKKSIIESLKL